jgi:hypothetical protein
MTIREKAGLFVVGVLGCTLALQRCNRSVTVKGPAKISYQDEGNVIDIQHRNAKTGKVTDQKIYEPDPGSTTITTDAHGNVTVHVRQFGVGFQPGFGIGISTKARVALDARLVYAHRFGLNSGLAFSLNGSDYASHSKLLDMVDPYVGVGYVPWLRAPNTSVVAALTADKHLFGFVRFKF